MSEATLVIGNKRSSSWSMRAWLFLKHHGVNFREVVVNQDQPGGHAIVAKYSPSGRLPVLLSNEFAVWESLAICEFAAEWFALPAAWPMAPGARAMARSVAQEMQSGFLHLRRELSFDVSRSPAPAAISASAQADVARVRSIWRAARARFGSRGDWLFGQFGIADAMFAPMALRLHQYAVDLDGAERDYVAQVLDHHAVQAWTDSVMHAPKESRSQPASTTGDDSMRSVVLAR
jgi:glutathione S-transferase